MPDYAKTEIPNSFAIKSIVTVYYLDFQKLSPMDRGEAHNFWEFQYVDKGSYQVAVDDKAYALQEGQLIFFPPLAYHGGVPDRPPANAQIGIVSFECDSEKMEFFRDKIFTLNAEQRELLSRIITSGTDLFCVPPRDIGLWGVVPTDNVQDYELQAFQNLLELFLIELYKPKHTNAASPSAQNQENYKTWQINRVILFLKNHLGEAVSLEEMAAEADISVSYLKKLFKEAFNCGPLNYFLLMKTEEAKRMIRESSMNFTQIADALGFSSVHYFSKLFKEKTGLTPTDYAKSIYKK